MTIVLDRKTMTACGSAMVALQLLLFSGGWISAEILRPVPPSPVRLVPLVPIVRLPLPPPVVEAVVAAPAPPPRPRARSGGFYAELIRDVALRNAVSPALVEAVVRVESDFDVYCVSPKGARGLMQVMPETAARFGVRDPEHLFRPAANLSAGTAYLAWLMKRYDGDLDLVLAAYNAGEGAVDGYGGIPPYRETREYVRRVRKTLVKMGA